MKKRIAAIVLCAVLSFGLVGCNQTKTARTASETQPQSDNRSASNRSLGFSDWSVRYGNLNTSNGKKQGKNIRPFESPQEEENDPEAPRIRYRLMLENGHTHDTDGFLFDGENSHHSTF